MPATYDRLGIHFVYPENWRLEEEETIAWPRSISVESPLGAFWSVMIHEEGTNPEAAAKETLEVLRSEYEEVEFEPVWEELGQRPVKGFDLEFFYLDLLIRIHLRAFTVGDQTLVVQSQGEDRDFASLADVFRAMTESLVRPK